MEMTIETITPELAETYLARMPKYQRMQNKRFVQKMASDMENGRWKFTHQGIAFNLKGEMFDGQHRMSAIIMSGVPITIAVFRDVEEDAWHAVDIGRKRDLAAVTGIAKKEVEAYRSACDIGFGVREPSFEELDIICKSRIGEVIRDLMEYAPTNRRGVGAAPVRLVVAIWKIKSGLMYPFEQYRALTLSQYNLMSNASQSLNRQLDASAAKTRKITSYDMVARAYRVFDPSASMLSKIQVIDIGTITEKIGMDIREIVKSGSCHKWVS